MIYITGDTHGSVDIEKLYKENFNPVNMTKDDYVIILGDFGFIWKNVVDKTELYWMNFFKNKPWKTLFIDGNHCLSKDTEILTDKGWVNIVNIYENLSDYLIATMNLENNEISFEKVLIKHKTFKDKAVVIESTDTKQVVSLDHDVIIRDKKVKAIDLLGKTIKNGDIPIFGKYKTDEINISNDMIRKHDIIPYMINYNDYMYCFTTKNGTLVTRNNYKIAITGNCNFNRLNQYDVQQWNGGKIHYISDSVIHLMRGQVFTLQGKTFFTFGGAQSYDKQYRIPNVSWWQDEIPSYKEIEEGFTNLEQHDYTVDYVLTHTSPSRFVQKMLPYAYPTDPTHKMLDAFEEKLKFKEWFFGHWHMDRHLSSKYRVVYHDVFKLF